MSRRNGSVKARSKSFGRPGSWDSVPPHDGRGVVVCARKCQSARGGSVGSVWRRVPTLRQVLARAIGGVAIIGLIAGAAACNKSSSSDNTAGGSNCGYKLAFFGALTGSAANLGVNIEQGFE